MALVDKKNSVTYVQASPSTTWVVKHDLGTVNPMVNIWVDIDGQTTAMLPKNIRVNDVNSITVTFSTPHAGTLVVQ